MINKIRLCNICQKDLNRKQKKFCSHKCRIIYIKENGTSQYFTEETIKKLKKPRSNETKQKIKEATKAENCRKEGIFSCDRCNKVYNTNTSLRAHKATCSHEKIKSICECCNLEFNTKAGLNIHINSIHKKTFEEKESMSNKMKHAKSKENSKVRKTSIEEGNFFEEIKKIFLIVERNFKIKDFYHVYDFYIPEYNLIIEFDGDFWHGNKEKFSLSNRMKKQFKLDENSFVYARDNSYNIIRLWSSMSLQFLEKVKECLLKHEKLILNQLEEVVRKEFSILG